MSPQLHQLSQAECIGRLGQGGVGRLAFQAPSGQQIILVNFAAHQDALVFRTTPYSQVGLHAPGSDAALEVDELDSQHQTGWCVVARGPVHVVTSPAELTAIKHGHDPEPWAGGVRQLYLKLVWREVTGRRIEAEQPCPPQAPVVGGRQIPVAPDIAGTRAGNRTGQPPRW